MSSQEPSVIDLLTPDEMEAVRALQELIIAKTAETRKRVVKILSKHITVSYYLGAEKAINQLKLPIQPTSIGVQGLDTVINELSPILEESFSYLAKDLTDVIEDGVRNNLSYWQIKEQLQEKLKTFGNRIPFQRAGKYREIVKVSPTGKLRLVKRRIRRNITIKTERYADMLARTSTKKAYALGHIEGYKQAGLGKWRYTAVADERTRPHHLALHGKVLEVGSEEEQLALKVMGEPNCRCRPIPFFEDPRFDTPHKEYERQKKEWAKQALDELKNKDSKRAKYLKKLLGDERLQITGNPEIDEKITRALNDFDTILKEGKGNYSRAVNRFVNGRDLGIAEGEEIMKKLYKKHMKGASRGLKETIMLRFTHKVNPKVIDKAGMVEIKYQTSGYPHYNSIRKRITLLRNHEDEWGHFMHEYAHHIDDQLIMSKTNEFYLSRIKKHGFKVRRLNTYKKYKRVGDDIYVFEGFEQVDPYMSRFYGGDTDKKQWKNLRIILNDPKKVENLADDISTEFVSVGVEQFRRDELIKRFYENDREAFGFILSVLRGDFI